MERKESRLLAEGEVSFEVPAGEVTKSDEVFYNPVMEFPRDVSIAVYKALLKQGTFLDALSASGIRALRVAKEVGLDVTANDLNPHTTQLIQKNAEHNGVQVRVVNRDASPLMLEEHFDVVDIDPFGTPVPYLDAAVRCAKKFLSVTATDTAVLCGTYPATAWRRYLSRTRHTDSLHEFGLRVLAGYVIRNAARFDLAAEPIFCHSKFHYYRLYFRMGHGAVACGKLLDQVGLIEDKGQQLGPVFTGELWEKPLVDEVLQQAGQGRFGTGGEMLKLLEVLKEEAGMPAFYYDIHALCRSVHAVVPPFSLLWDRLRSEGIEVSRTHFSPLGMRARCSAERIKEVLSSIPS